MVIDFFLNSNYPSLQLSGANANAEVDLLGQDEVASGSFFSLSAQSFASDILDAESVEKMGNKQAASASGIQQQRSGNSSDKKVVNCMNIKCYFNQSHNTVSFKSLPNLVATTLIS